MQRAFVAIVHQYVYLIDKSTGQSVRPATNRYNRNFYRITRSDYPVITVYLSDRDMIQLVDWIATLSVELRSVLLNRLRLGVFYFIDCHQYSYSNKTYLSGYAAVREGGHVGRSVLGHHDGPCCHGPYHHFFSS